MKTLSFCIISLITFLNVCWPRPIDTALQRTVMIIVFDEQSQPVGIGSGFVISEDGQIATNRHVLEGGTTALVKFQDDKRTYEVTSITHQSAEHDLAVVQVDRKSKALKLVDDTFVQVGDEVYAVGNPEGLEGTLSEGIVSGFRKLDDNFRLMQITAPISPGSSGGPVINKEGLVIGIASASHISGQNLNFAIPASVLDELMQKPATNQMLPIQTSGLNPGALTKGDESIDFVSAFNFFRKSSSGDKGSIAFSIRNESRRDITRVKLLIIWKDISGEPLHFSPIIVDDVIPSKLTKRVEKNNLDGVGNLPAIRYEKSQIEVRVLDYKILDSSGLLEFE